MAKILKDMIRQHQFYKVELVSIVEPKNCSKELGKDVRLCGGNIKTT